jgi:hypothetical protein
MEVTIRVDKTQHTKCFVPFIITLLFDSKAISMPPTWHHSRTRCPSRAQGVSLDIGESFQAIVYDLSAWHLLIY